MVAAALHRVCVPVRLQAAEGADVADAEAADRRRALCLCYCAEHVKLAMI